ncbi:hypothetical protein AGMMS49975_19530 [Clostridia bacterium]|nr:hypothetical protein AGMMS49975_19530 [Clostridia bacterium]
MQQIVREDVVPEELKFFQIRYRNRDGQGFLCAAGFRKLVNALRFVESMGKDEEISRVIIEYADYGKRETEDEYAAQIVRNLGANFLSEEKRKWDLSGIGLNRRRL